MAVTKDHVVCHLRPFRKARGISQSELATRVGVKRQAVYDMETGRYVPNTALALRIAKELGCGIDSLFALEALENERPVTLVDSECLVNPRVAVALIREQFVAYPLDCKWMLSEGFQAADGLLSPDFGHVQLLQSVEDLEKKVLLLGCDPAFSILGAHASRCAAVASVQCRFASSRLALERVAAGHAHVAGTHLHNPSSEESNLIFARKLLAGSKGAIVAFSSFEEGLMVAPGNPRKIKSVADLANKGIRFVNRESGAALRALLDDRLAQHGLTGENIDGYYNLVSSHVLGAHIVSLNIADAALGLRAVAAAHGLDFVPMEAVRCDLVIPEDLLELPAIKVLLDVLQTKALRDELSSLPGYDASCTGKLIGRL